MSHEYEFVQFVAKSDFLIFLSFNLHIIIFLFFDIFNQVLEKCALISVLIQDVLYTQRLLLEVFYIKKKSWVYTESGNSRRLLFKWRSLISEVHLFLMIIVICVLYCIIVLAINRFRTEIISGVKLTSL